MSISETSICNMALARIGARRIVNLDDTTDTKPEAQQCRLFYEQTRDALQRSHLWGFNKARATLSRDTSTPTFEYSYQYHLPNDLLRVRSVYDDDGAYNRKSSYSASIEGDLWLTNQSAVYMIYSKKVTDPNTFDPLFVEVLVLHLAMKLLMPLSGGNPDMKAELMAELRPLEAKVRALDRNESFQTNRNEQYLWNDARYSSGTGDLPSVSSS